MAMNLTDMRLEIERHKKAINHLWDAYFALTEGGVRSYTIGSRSLTRFDLQTISQELAMHEKKVRELESALANGGKRRKVVGIVPRDW